MREIVKGATSITLNIVLRDSTTGLGKTGLAFGDITGSYTRNRAARTAITMQTLASASAAWASGGFIEVDATNCPGLYRFDVPDAAFATGVRNVVMSAKATGVITEHEEVILTGWDNQDAVRGGLTALPNAAAGATGGLDCAVAFGGTATAGAANSITLPAGGSAVDNTYNHQVIQITGGTGVGQARTIAAYNGTTKVAIVSRGWRTNPDNTSVFQIKGFDFQPSTSVVGGFVQATTGTTLTLPATASAVDNYYNGALMAITGGTAVGQTRVVKSYNGTTKVVTVARPFDTTPDTTSVVLVLQAAQPAIDTNLAVDVANINTGAIVSGSFAVDSITSASLSTGAATEIAGAIWDEARSGHTTAGSFGHGVASVQGNVTGSTASVTGAVGSVTGNVGGNVTGSVGSVVSFGTLVADVATAVWAAATRTLTAISDSSGVTTLLSRLSAGRATNLDNLDAAVTTRATAASIAALNNLSTTQVKTQVVDALNTDTYAEPSAVPAATATLAAKIGWIAALARNKMTQTATTQSLRNAGDSANIGTSSDTDDGSVYTRGGWS